MSIDVNCLLGHWPFRKLYKNTLKDLMKVHQHNHIDYGFVSSLNAVFYNDPFEGDEELHEIIRGTPYKHVLTVNPELPGWESDIDRGLKQFGISGVRVYPTYHGYDLTGDELENLCLILERYGLPLFLTVRLEDERLEYLLKSTPLQIVTIGHFIRKHPGLPILLLNIRYAELLLLKEDINGHPRAYFDTSGLKDGIFVVEKLLDHFSPDRMMYGSQYPLYCLKSTHLLVDRAEIGPETKALIFGASNRLAAI